MTDKKPADPFSQSSDEPVHSGDDHLMAVYTELRKLARARLRKAGRQQSLQATGLVHEAYLRLMKNREGHAWNSRGHFFGAAARAMRDILVEYARKKNALKHGGGQLRVDITIDLADGERTVSAEELLALEQTLSRMQADHPRKAEIVLLRYFGGLSMDQIADIMDVSTRTIEREWRFARAWLHTRLTAG